MKTVVINVHAILPSWWWCIREAGLHLTKVPNLSPHNHHQAHQPGQGLGKHMVFQQVPSGEMRTRCPSLTDPGKDSDKPGTVDFHLQWPLCYDSLSPRKRTCVPSTILSMRINAVKGERSLRWQLFQDGDFFCPWGKFVQFFSLYMFLPSILSIDHWIEDPTTT